MTAYATRAPLQLINNPHMMSDLGGGGNGRRTSARLGDKEDHLPVANGIGHHHNEIEKKGQGKAAGSRSGKAGVNGAGARGGAKRKPVFDEEDDGFHFTRTRTKKAKAESAVQPQQQIPDPSVEQQEETAAPKPSRKSTRRKSVDSPTAAPAAHTLKVEKKRRSPRNSGAQDNAEMPSLPVAKRKRKSKEPVESAPPPQGEDGKDQASGPPAAEHSDKDDRTQPVEITFDATKISLPFADTPIIRRNQEMRKGAANGSRRSSLGMRGRRASSLIDTGKSNALPHDGVESVDFYKHIESESLPEPRRMRQLLTWCGTRALGERPTLSGDDANANAKLAAREIQSQLLKDFGTRSDMSDWFSRNESTPPPSVPKPNPKNVSNLAKIQDLEQQISRLQSERQEWESLLRPPPTDTLSLPPPPPPSSEDPASSTTIDASLLSSPHQQAALQTLRSFQNDGTTSQPILEKETSSRLRKITKNLEFSIDKFAQNVHVLDSYKIAAERLADEALAEAAEVLEGREREGGRRVNINLDEASGGGSGNGSAGEGGVATRDVLRSLSRVVDR